MIADAESGAGYIGYYDGGAFGIPYSSKNKEAALLWVQFIGRSRCRRTRAAAGARIVMESTFRRSADRRDPDQKVSGYYTLMRVSPLYRGAAPLPFHNTLRGNIDTFIWQALAGEIGAATALDAPALRLGRDDAPTRLRRVSERISMRSNRMGWGLLAPTLIILGIMGLLPFFYVLVVGFFDWNVVSATGKPIWTERANLSTAGI